MDRQVILREVEFKAIRSSGAGGQHVNKVSSKVVLSFDISNSLGLNENEKLLLLKNLAKRLTKDNVLSISVEESRSQFRNKSIAISRLFKIIAEGVVKPTVRKATKPTKGAVKRRVAGKKRIGEKKKLRRKPTRDE